VEKNHYREGCHSIAALVALAGIALDNIEAGVACVRPLSSC
jgi:hypothetical protein